MLWAGWYQNHTATGTNNPILTVSYRSHTLIWWADCGSHWKHNLNQTPFPGRYHIFSAPWVNALFSHWGEVDFDSEESMSIWLYWIFILFSCRYVKMTCTWYHISIRYSQQPHWQRKLSARYKWWYNRFRTIYRESPTISHTTYVWERYIFV